MAKNKGSEEHTASLYMRSFLWQLASAAQPKMRSVELALWRMSCLAYLPKPLLPGQTLLQIGAGLSRSCPC
uniref:Uncharacterized protein n=1 Tax=Arundo donax TaxID=35708 RepID=A0A0A9EYK8_ARUDO